MKIRSTKSPSFSFFSLPRRFLIASFLQLLIRDPSLEALTMGVNLRFGLTVWCASQFILYHVASDGSDFVQADVTNDSRYVLGREQYEILKKESRMPKYSKCWTTALDALENGCEILTEDVQHRLALGFTNCFLLKTGRVDYPCEMDQEIDTCVKTMSSEAYNSYSNFFTHTQNICFFLQAQVWQEETEKTVQRLSDSSENVAKQMEDSGQLQELIMQKQNDSIRNQKVLIEHGNKLRETLEESTVDVHNMLKEFKASTSEQKALMFEVFDRISALQNIVMGELTGFYSLIFYAVAIAVSYLLTSTPRASGARFWLFVLMTCNMVIERLLVMYGAKSSTDVQGAFIDENAAIYNRLWVCRKVFTLAGIGVWGWVAYHYKDLNKINNQLLLQIQQQNHDLKHLLQSSQSQTPQLQNVKTSVPALAPVQTLLQDKLPQLDDTDNAITCSVEKVYDQDTPQTGYEGDTDSSETSSESGISDHSYLPKDRNEWSDAESIDSFMTTDSGRGSSEGMLVLRQEAEDLRQSTPLREITPLRYNVDKACVDAVKRQIFSSPMRRIGRSSDAEKKPVADGCQYFLRSMRGQAFHKPNPITDTESAQDFGRKVKNLASIAIRNRRKTRATLEHMRPRGSMLFSDDEN